ncbi:hypothetical protein [Streptomyces sp. RFCAC02]|uniref:hypothetical protein n=1 Tax=Streptomyces sp. RFCAC02 TaxID=2499143 RepID=UPI00101F9871|nr:hypothetical protein [Streptomyces sp. RFCAC02]
MSQHRLPRPSLSSKLRVSLGTSAVGAALALVGSSAANADAPNGPHAVSQPDAATDSEQAATDVAVPETGPSSPTPEPAVPVVEQDPGTPVLDCSMPDSTQTDATVDTATPAQEHPQPCSCCGLF